MQVLLPNEGEIEHGKEVDLECDEGYYRSGPDRRRCWQGGGGEAKALKSCRFAKESDVGSYG